MFSILIFLWTESVTFFFIYRLKNSLRKQSPYSHWLPFKNFTAEQHHFGHIRKRAVLPSKNSMWPYLIINCPLYPIKTKAEWKKWNKRGVFTSHSHPSSPLESSAEREQSSGCTEGSVPSSWIWSRQASCCQACCIRSSSTQSCTRPQVVSSGASRHHWSDNKQKLSERLKAETLLRMHNLQVLWEQITFIAWVIK